MIISTWADIRIGGEVRNLQPPAVPVPGESVVILGMGTKRAYKAYVTGVRVGRICTCSAHVVEMVRPNV